MTSRIFLAAGLLAGAIAQADPAPLTLDTAYKAALSRSETLAEQQELVVQAREHINQAWGALSPNINGLAYQMWQYSPQGQYSGATSDAPTNQPVLKVTANQPLFRGGREYAALDVTERLADAQIQAREAAKVQVFSDVSGAFFAVLAAERDLKNLDQEAKFFDERIKELQERVDIGRSQSSEVLSVQSDEATLDALVMQVRGADALARETLSFLTGLPGESVLEDLSHTAAPLPPMDELLKHVQERPEVKEALLRDEFSKANVKVNSGAHWPDLDLNADYYYLPDTVAAPTPKSDNTSLWDVQLALSVPIFAGLQVSSKVREAESQLRAADLDLARLRREAEHDIRSAALNVSSDQTQIDALVKAVDAADKNYKEQKSKYRLGLVTNLDVIQAVLSLVDNQRSLDKANYTLQQDEARLKAATAQLP